VPLVTVPLAAIITSTPRSRLLRIDIRHAGFRFQAGQAVLLGQHGVSKRRPYSIACSPEQAAESNLLDLLVATERDGGLGAHLASAAPGAPLDIDGPLGSFTLPEFESTARVLLVAGGTGIAPLRSMLDHILRRQPARRVSLLYSARGSNEFAFIDELQVRAHVVSKGAFAAPHHDRAQEQMALVDQPRVDCVAGELGPPDGDVGPRGLLEPPDGVVIELPLDPRPRAGHRLKRPGVHDLLSCPPDLGRSR